MRSANEPIPARRELLNEAPVEGAATAPALPDVHGVGSDATWHGADAVVGEHVAVERIERRVVDVHAVTVSQIQRWCDGVAVSPDDVLRRKRVKAMLAG